MKKVLFSEKQQFRQWWNILLILAATVLSTFFAGYALYQQLEKVLFGTQKQQAILHAMDEVMKSKTGNLKY